MFDGVAGRGRRTPCRVASAVVAFIYSHIDRVADGPAEEGLQTKDSAHLYFFSLSPTVLDLPFAKLQSLNVGCS